VVDTAGDSVLSVFPSTNGAVRAALAIQADLKPRNEALPEARRMRFRIGVNLGDVIEKSDGTVYGDGVNIAARLEALAEPGGVTISGTTFDQVDGKLDVGFEYLGEKEVKNIARPVRAYRAELDDTEAKPQSTTKDVKRLSIAVLSFENLSGDPDQEYFADGIAEDLITELSRLRWLQVTARNSSFSYKGQSPDIRDVGRDLGVGYVVEGSVRKGGTRSHHCTAGAWQGSKLARRVRCGDRGTADRDRPQFKLGPRTSRACFRVRINRPIRRSHLRM
jgi:adenylate cyclase